MSDDRKAGPGAPGARPTDTELRERLTPEQYAVTQRCGTEPPFTGEYYDCKKSGTYRCVCCGEALFESGHKYDSGSGWPSFYQPTALEQVEHLEDLSHGMRRVEVRCKSCGAHLGHVFDDGPNPTGQRYCINSVALELEEKSLDDE